jgi:uncharacterized protein (DUF1015 family)
VRHRAGDQEDHVPQIRPFRALRYSREAVPDLAAVVAPPYDVIGPEEHRRLLARDPRNVVRLDLPAAEAGDDPDERYRRAARTLAAWRSDGTLRREPRPAVYVYDQEFVVPGTSATRTRRGFFARVRLEPFGAASGVHAHERTMSAPKEDRYRLLRATGVNTSPVVGAYGEPTGRVAALLDEVGVGAPDGDLTDEAGVRHRLWVVPTVADAGGRPSIAAELADLAGVSSITIADGHHRYETALRYRDEREVGATGDPDPAYDYVLMLLLEPRAGPITVLATHRVLLGLGEPGVEALRSALGELFEVRAPVEAEELAATFSPAADAPGGEGRFGLWTRAGGAILHARREAFEALLPAGGDAVRRLDVTLLDVALDRLASIDGAAIAAGGRIAFTKDAREAIAAVDDAREGADAAFLLDPTPAAEMTAVAADGDVMPQKSTYIYPKALTGLVINPLEW